MDVYDIKNILKLKREKKYDEIYKNYGQIVYLNFVPTNYKRKDINRLITSRRFFDLYKKYGEQCYQKNIFKIMKSDMENELGIKITFNNKLLLEKMKCKFKIIKRTAIESILGMSVLLNIIFSHSYNDLIKESNLEYQNEFNDYNNEIEEYAKYINSLNLSDFEIILKVINDMWSNIDGYKTPDSYDDIGCYRLSLYMNGYGVCRNMADDFTARMNAINPNYEAHNINVFIKDCEVNNIERNILETNNNTLEEQNKNTELIKDIIGNHMVTCLKLTNENVFLIVDPTNPSIGVLKNGKIYMLSNNTINGIDFKLTGTLIFNYNEKDEFIKLIAESYIQNSDIDFLTLEYGINSQNITLEKIKKYTTKNYNIK